MKEKIQYAVCHLQRGAGNDAGMSCHIERKDANGKTYVPANADKSRTHLNRELLTFPEGVHSRTAAIQHRIDHAGLHRKVGKSQTKAVRIILSGTHGQMMRIERQGKLPDWMAANVRWLQDTFGKENVVSCVLHMDEQTPHMHATVVPIVITERKRKAREGEQKYRTKSGSRLSADDVMARGRLKQYQDTYAAAMRPFGLQRGIVGSIAKHMANGNYYKRQMQECEENIARLQADIEKTKEGKSTILALFGKGDLAKAKKEIGEKDKEIAALKAKLQQAMTEKALLCKQHQADIDKLKNGYKAEIAAAIKRAESAEKKFAEQAETIRHHEQKIAELDRKANPQRYRLSSGAELVNIFVPNFQYPSLHIWTKVGEETYDVTKFRVDYNTAQQYKDGELTDEEFVNEVFEPQEQVSRAQARLLGAVLYAATGGEAQAHVSTGGGGSNSELGWRDKDKDTWKMRRKR